MSQAPDVGVCVLNWNSGAMLARCLERLFDSVGESFRAIVVDNASSDVSVSLAQRRFPGISVIVNESNLGYAAGNNVGARALMEFGCRFLVFANPDVLVGADSLAALIAMLRRDARAGCVGGVPEIVGSHRSTAARTRPTKLEQIVSYGPLIKLRALERSVGSRHLVDPASLEDGAPIYAPCGAFIAFRAEAFRDIGGFDEATFLYFEEFITAERLSARGWLTLLSKRATYSHIGEVSTDRIPYKRRLHYIASEQYLLARYYRWPVLVRTLILVQRCIEWCLYAARWTLVGPRSLNYASQLDRDR